MCRMLLDCQDAENKIVPCHDLYLQGHPNSHDILFLPSYKTLEPNVFSLPIFGGLD